MIEASVLADDHDHVFDRRTGRRNVMFGGQGNGRVIAKNQRQVRRLRRIYVIAF